MRLFTEPSAVGLRARSGVQRQGATLVELLVVFALIALLAGVLVPSMSQSMRLANDTICKVRLREISHALNVYQMENHSWMPVTSYVDMGLLSPPRIEPWFAKLFPNYLVDPMVLTCPEDPMGFRMAKVGSDLSDPNVADYVSYGINGFMMSAGGGALAEYNRLPPKRPQDTILLADLGPDHRRNTAAKGHGGLEKALRGASILAWDDGFDPFAGQTGQTWLTTRHGTGINMLTPAWSVREARTANLIDAPIRRFYHRCAAGGCTLCNDLGLFHYSFAQDQLYWWTGPAPSGL